MHCQVDWEKTFTIFYILLECFFCRWVDTTGKCRRAWPAFESPLYFLRAPEPGSSSVWTLLESMLKSSGSVNTKQKANLQLQLLVSLSVLVAQSYNQFFNIHKFYKYSNFDHFIQWILNDMVKHFSKKFVHLGISFYIHTTYRMRVNPDKLDFNTLRVDVKTFESSKTNLRIQKFRDTCGRGLIVSNERLRIQFQPRLHLYG